MALLRAAAPDDALRDGATALRLARRACPNVDACGPEFLDALAAALAETGRFHEATEVARRALARARESSRIEDRELIGAISQRLELYESGQPYRLPSR